VNLLDLSLALRLSVRAKVSIPAMSKAVELIEGAEFFADVVFNIVTIIFAFLILRAEPVSYNSAGKRPEPRGCIVSEKNT
jgi:hypothetical protein